LVEDNRAVAFLKSQGYRFAFFPSQWWLATRHNRHADVEADVAGGFEMLRELGRTDLRRHLRMGSMLDLLHRESVWRTADADHLKRTFAALALVPGMPGPVFAFAHVLSPHRPFTFDRECHPLPRLASGTDSRGQYVAQVECLDRLVLRLVTRLLHDSELPPIILLQGDHGSDPPTFADAPTAEAISPIAAEERLGAFGAYYLPDGGEKEFGDSVAVANVLGNVFRHYFGAELPREPDDMYLSSYRAPYALRRVSFSWLAQADSLPPGGAPTAWR
ncbi:MAG: sulfatase-like hydrolase/transferase, partial [Gemmatimonadales bacterium]